MPLRCVSRGVGVKLFFVGASGSACRGRIGWVGVDVLVGLLDRWVTHGAEDQGPRQQRGPGHGGAA